MAALRAQRGRITCGYPDPDLIIGAGHRTHLPMLTAKWMRGGRTIVLMKPSFPVSWFDYCLIPEHDCPPKKANIILTRGALNTVIPANARNPDKGLILIGGPSRHYSWNESMLETRLRKVLEKPRLNWILTDSPRTPDTTRSILAAMHCDNLVYQPFDKAARGWLAGELSSASATWVTEDSISMIYESMTAGAAVGIFPVPVKRTGRVTRAVKDLLCNHLVTSFDDWINGRPLLAPTEPLNESFRCAKLILDHLCVDYGRPLC